MFPKLTNPEKPNFPIEKSEITRVQAKMMFKNEPFKIEHLEDLKYKIYSAKQGNFEDLCGGKHVKSTGEIKAFKLTKLAGAYWKGDQRNEQMQRVYGIAFSSEKERALYLLYEGLFLQPPAQGNRLPGDLD